MLAPETNKNRTETFKERPSKLKKTNTPAVFVLSLLARLPSSGHKMRLWSIVHEHDGMIGHLIIVHGLKREANEQKGDDF